MQFQINKNSLALKCFRANKRLIIKIWQDKSAFMTFWWIVSSFPFWNSSVNKLFHSILLIWYENRAVCIKSCGKSLNVHPCCLSKDIVRFRASPLVRNYAIPLSDSLTYLANKTTNVVTKSLLIIIRLYI